MEMWCRSFKAIIRGMGSGMVPKDLGFMLQDRGEMFSLDSNHKNSLVGGKRPFLHNNSSIHNKKW